MKFLVMFRKKPGMSHTEFRRYYETSHVPLLSKHMPFIREYRRNYVDPNVTRMPAGAAAPCFDVITEVRLDSEEDFKAYRDTLAMPEVLQEILADEANFIEPNSVWRLAVTEIHSLI